MSLKRRASTELNHENWDAEDPKKHEELGTLKTASKEVLEKRVIRTAKRRTQISGAEPRKNIFSGFGSVNKMQKTSFDILANLTNGNKNSNDIAKKTEASVTSSLFTNKPVSSSSGVNFGTSLPLSKKGMTSSETPTIFGSSNTCAAISVFASKADSTVKDSTRKTQSVSSSGDTNNTEITKVTNSSTIITTPQVTSSIFGTPTTTTTPNKTVSSTTNTSPFKIQPILNSSTSANTNTPTALSVSQADTKKDSEKAEEYKIQYYSKLKGLNESVSDWIKKHVDDNPLCILTPIFRDYEKYLKEIQAEYESAKKENSNNKAEVKCDSESIKNAQIVTSSKNTSVFGTSNNIFTKGNPFKTDNPKQSLFAPNVDNSTGKKPTGFTFGINNSSIKSTPVSVSTTTGFSFGIKPSIQTSTLTTSLQSNVTTSTPLSSTTNTQSNVTTSTPLSFTTNTQSNVTTSTPLSFTTNTQSNVTTSTPLSFTTNTQSNVTTSTPLSFTTNTQSNVTTSTPLSFTTNTQSNVTTSTPLSFTTNTQSNVTTSKPLSFNTNTNTPVNGATPFSFSNDKPFSFGSNTSGFTNNTENKNDTKEGQENEDAPPKVEFTPITEENSVFDKRCKIFVKKDANFVDKGVGTLYIKKIEGSEKHQLLVRANTSLGNILLNLRLSSAIPTQKMGKNNVMIVCIPTPDSKPPPTSVLIRVKTSEEADELLEVLNKHKT